MTLKELLATLYEAPETLEFKSVLEAIDSEFEFTPTAFTNGSLVNLPQQNQGSCKIFSFAHKSGLAPAHTLWLFAEHYKSVLDDPTGSEHQNIREFMSSGWKGVSFEKMPLKKK